MDADHIRYLAEAIYWQWDRIEAESEKIGDMNKAMEHHITELEKILSQRTTTKDESRPCQCSSQPPANN